MLDASYYEKTDEIIACHTREERSLIPIIQDIQEEYRYLPPELLSYVPKKLAFQKQRLSALQVFMRTSRLKQRANMLLKSVMVRPVMCVNQFRYWKDYIKELGLNKDKHTTDDQLFTVETVSCLGACGLAPAVMINDEVYGKNDTGKNE